MCVWRCMALGLSEATTLGHGVYHDMSDEIDDQCSGVCTSRDLGWEKRRLEDPSRLCTHLTLKHPTSTRRLADHMMSSRKRYYVHVMDVGWEGP